MTRVELMRRLESTLSVLHGVMEFLLISSLAVEACIVYTNPPALTRHVAWNFVNLGAQILSSWMLLTSYILLLVVPMLLLVWLVTLCHCSFRGVLIWQQEALVVAAAQPDLRSPYPRRSDRCAGGDGWWLEDSEDNTDSDG